MTGMSAKCPRCGFGYVWDGTSCGHCRYPRSKPTDADEWVETRILWLANRDNLALEKARFLDNLTDDLRIEFEEPLECGAANRIGKPVLIFHDTPGRWTLLGTHRVLSMHGGEQHAAAIEKVQSMQPGIEPHRVEPHTVEPPRVEQRGEALQPKYRRFWEEIPWEYLHLIDATGRSATIWVPSGNSAWFLLKLVHTFSPNVQFVGSGS